MLMRFWILVALVVGLAAVDARADDPARLGELDRLLGAGQAEQAVERATGFLEDGDIEPWNVWRFQQRLGVALVASGRPAEAVPVLELALAGAPDDPTLHLNLGRALRAIGHGGRAVSEFQVAVNLAPQRHDWLLEYAEALLALGIRRDALVQIRRARSICDDCLEALRGEVNYLMAVGQWADTVEPLRRIQAGDPSVATRRLLVQILWNLDDAAGVAAVLDTIPEAQLDGDELALILEVDRRLGRVERAQFWVSGDGETVARVARPTDQVWALVSEICLAGGDLDAALVAIDRAVELEAEVAVYHHNRAAILVALGRDDEARRALDESTRLDPNLGRSP